MNIRVRKLIGLVGLLAWLGFYVGLMLNIADHVPENLALQMAFFVVAGTFWFVPILPLIKWMSRP